MTNTFHAPPNKASDSMLASQLSLITSNELVEILLDNTFDLSFIINMNRQVLYANKALLDLLGMKDAQELIGLRPGEMVDCIHVAEGDGGCGTSLACRYCAIVNSVLESQTLLSEVKREAKLTVFEGDGVKSLEYIIKAKSVKFKEEIFTFVSLSDISQVKRKLALERVFYHDILNKAGGIKGILDLLRYENQGNDLFEVGGGDIESLYKITDELINEIISHKKIVLAENNELSIDASDIELDSFLADRVKFFRMNDLYRGIDIELKAQSGIRIISDRILLSRVIDNLIKNALEASEPSMKVEVDFSTKAERVLIWIKSQRPIPDEDRSKIFARSFSTKGKDRGIGTYSVKLLTERYLEGKVGFISEEGKGTVFCIDLPKNIINQK